MRPPLYIDFDGSLNRTYDGYPAYEDDEYFEYSQSHHTCSECDRKYLHESIMKHTTWGWMCEDCYDEILTNAIEDDSEKPELI